MANFKLACVVLMCMVLLYAQNGYAVTCGQVTSNILPCVGYLQNGGPVTTNCCNGVRAIANAAARSIADIRTTCYCLKSAAERFKSIINENNAASLPGKCGINLPFKINYSINCASIK
ncbi:non-specific lipid-transfer protein [Trifolium pratense]|uniref:Non-specific lipid-transfer protein n=1 Tax=Trifolium pratense TaxID=57577 RepID=A0A2K3P4W5_TRIPR|nr:non-specific lipid-transfer protein [Trifolium pratense]